MQAAAPCPAYQLAVAFLTIILPVRLHWNTVDGQSTLNERSSKIASDEEEFYEQLDDYKA